LLAGFFELHEGKDLTGIYYVEAVGCHPFYFLDHCITFNSSVALLRYEGINLYSGWFAF